LAFLSLGFAQLFHVFNAWVENGSVFKQGIFSNRNVWWAIALTTALMCLAVYLLGLQMILKTTPPSLAEWLVIGLAASVPVIVIETYKMIAEIMSNRTTALR
jgi:Ca2+-transporting ATPase